jgi:hypothetical protein
VFGNGSDFWNTFKNPTPIDKIPQEANKPNAAVIVNVISAIHASPDVASEIIATVKQGGVVQLGDGPQRGYNNGWYPASTTLENGTSVKGFTCATGVFPIDAGNRNTIRYAEGNVAESASPGLYPGAENGQYLVQFNETTACTNNKFYPVKKTSKAPVAPTLSDTVLIRHNYHAESFFTFHPNTVFYSQQEENPKYAIAVAEKLGTLVQGVGNQDKKFDSKNPNAWISIAVNGRPAWVCGKDVVADDGKFPESINKQAQVRILSNGESAPVNPGLTYPCNPGTLSPAARLAPPAH